MILGIYAVFDSKAETFCRPFTQANDAVAKRAFLAAAQEQGNEVNKYPEDYFLYKLGSYDDETGEITGGKPVSMGNAASGYLKMEKV